MDIIKRALGKYSPIPAMGYAMLAASLTLSSCAASNISTSVESGFEVVSPCPFPAAKNADQSRLTCGYLTVPENRESPTSQAIRIPVAIIKTLSAVPQTDPVVFLHGGPGGGSLSSERVFDLFSQHMFGTNRDIILLDQRGALMTEPNLRCDDLQTQQIDAYAENLTLTERDEKLSKLATDCLISLKAEGRDLHGYSAVENAQDLLDLRLSLGIDEWNLMAVSYGTLMALEAARVDKDGIRSLILDSLVSPESDLFMSEGPRNYSRAIGRIMDACTADASCDSAFPDLDEALVAVIADLKNQPILVTVSTDVPGETTEISINWHDFLSLTHWMLYNEGMTRLVPLLIDETHSGNPALLTYMADNVFPAPKNQGASALGAFLSIVCEDQYRTRPRTILAGDHDGFSIVSSIESTCSTPELGYADARNYSPLESAIPTLLLSGYFDPMTPDIYAEQVEKNMPQAIRVTIPNFGHSTLSGFTACQTVLANAFLDNLQRTDEFSCVNDLPPPAFITSVAEAMRIFLK